MLGHACGHDLASGRLWRERQKQQAAFGCAAETSRSLTSGTNRQRSEQRAVQERSAGSTEALGEAPHMVRGQLAGAAQAVLRGDAFSQCTACSPAVVAALRFGGWPFLLKALRVRASPSLPLPIRPASLEKYLLTKIVVSKKLKFLGFAVPLMEPARHHRCHLGDLRCSCSLMAF